MEMGERYYFCYQSNRVKEDKIFHQKLESHTFKLPPVKFSCMDKYQAEKMLQPQKGAFREKVPKGTTFHN